jgi:two-component system alkaline phosphatase synthesis response regulator PhoP
MTLASQQTPRTKAGAAKILVAEDEKDIRELVSFTLRFAGYEVWTASDGVEAVEIAKKVLPDLILMDVRMPRMTGYEACEILKQTNTLKDIPIVFLSAKGQESEIQQGLEAGAVAYILKPFAPADLALRVRELLAGFARKAQS